MELQPISEISKALNLSTRALRYYEQIGLIQSEKKEDYAYRVYSEDTVKRIQQILVLRKLRIPLKQISEILKSEDTAVIIETFRKNISEVDEEITALSTIRDIIAGFITRLNESVNANIKLNLLDDTDLLEAVDSLTVQQVALKEEKTAANLQEANEKLDKLTDRDVRIIYLPPMTVASVHCIGNSPEDRASDILREFVRTSDIAHIMPGFRLFGFNHPNGTNDDDHGYEYWITVPDDMNLPEPFVKKTFSGGLYAAHNIVMGAFEEWEWLWKWVENNAQFEFNLGDSECMNGMFEEHYNYFNQYNLKDFDKDRFQMDLLIPIREK